MIKDKKIQIFFWVSLAIYLIVIIFPFFWVMITSFKTEAEIWGDGAFRIIAQNPTIENYVKIFDRNIINAIKNSFIVALITTSYVTFIAIFTAYAIARLKFKGKSLLLGIILGVSMFPQMIVVGPVYNLFMKFGWTNSFFIVLPYSLITLPVSIYILVTHFKKIPFGLEEAARIDGATPLQTLFKVLLPLALPGIFTAAIIIFIAAWNEYLLSLTINTDISYHNVPVAVSFLRGQFSIFWGEITAATTIATIPTLLMVLLFQKQIISGLASGALKE